MILKNKKISLKEFIQWDIVNWSKALRFWNKFLPENMSKLTCLELGAGKGGLSLWLANKGANVICSDYISPSEEVINNHQKYSCSKLISYKSVDACSIGENNKYDIIVFKSILGGISRNQNSSKSVQAMEQIYKSLKEGGYLFFAENLKASPLHTFLRKNFIKWGASWNYFTLKEFESLLQPFSWFNYKIKGFFGSFGRNEIQRKILGIIDTILFDYVIPKNWKYIIYGVAKK